jgi:hypothetical protein
MADSKSEELRQRRASLSESLPALGRKREETYRLNSNALALDRAGVTHRGAQEIERLDEAQAAADAEHRDAQREIRRLDAEIASASNGGFGARLGRGRRRGRAER